MSFVVKWESRQIYQDNIMITFKQYLEEGKITDLFKKAVKFLNDAGEDTRDKEWIIDRREGGTIYMKNSITGSVFVVEKGGEYYFGKVVFKQMQKKYGPYKSRTSLAADFRNKTGETLDLTIIK